MNYDDKIVINNRKIINYDNVCIHNYKENVLFIVISKVIMIIVILTLMVVNCFFYINDNTYNPTKF